MFRNPFVSYCVAMITPFDQQEGLAVQSIHTLVDYYKKNHVPALLVSGSTGEQHSMSIEERITLYQEVRKGSGDDIIIIGGVAAVRTGDALKLAKATQAAKLNGMMLGFPPYLRISQKEAYSYVQQICNVTELPIMLYNNPARTGFNLELETLFKLVDDFPQIIALKEAGDPDNALLVKQKLGPSFTILTGFDLHIQDNMKNGYDGITSIIGNVFPLEMQQIVNYLKKQEWELAESAFSNIHPKIKFIMERGMLRTIKYLLKEKQICLEVCRSPLSSLNQEEKIEIHAFMDTLTDINK